MEKIRISSKALQQMTIVEFTKFAKDFIRPDLPHRGVGMHVDFPWDLRAGEEEKYKACHPHFEWTAFVNNAGTMVHLVCPEDELILRFKFGYPIKHLSPEKMWKAIEVRVGRRIKIK